jgi:hypothetical protein
MARPSSLTPAARARVRDALKAGAWRYEAARYAGVCPNTFGNWTRSDPVFAAEVEAAEAEAKQRRRRRFAVPG